MYYFIVNPDAHCGQGEKYGENWSAGFCDPEQNIRS